MPMFRITKSLLRRITLANFNRKHINNVRQTNLTLNQANLFASNPYSDNNPLNILANYYRTDKGGLGEKSNIRPWPNHTYSTVYDLIFTLNRSAMTNVLEIGIGSVNSQFPNNMTTSGKPGASLFMWRDYFTNATIYGGDIDRNTLFEQDRIRTGYLDSMNPASLCDFQTKMKNPIYDLVIDDGFHNFYANINNFEFFFKFLRSGGLYIIEDIKFQEYPLFIRYFLENNKNFIVFPLYNFKKIPNDDCFIVITA